MDVKVKNATLIIDGQEMRTADLSQAFLDNIVSESLLGNVEYELEGDHPLVKFFQALEDGTKEGSALRQKMNEMEAACAMIDEENSEKPEEGKGETQKCGNETANSPSQQ